MRTELKIRSYYKSDWDKVLEIFNRAKPDELRGSINPGEIVPLDKDEGLLKSFNESKIYIGELEGKVVGYSGVHGSLISFLFVDPDYYRNNYGTILLERVLSEAGERAWLLVAKNNIAAQALYNKFNFKIAEEFVGKYNGREIEVLRLALKPELESWKKPIDGKNIKIAAFQFRGSDNIENNLCSIERGIKEANKQNVRFLITQECALCGYPPVERDSVNSINFDLMNKVILKIKKMAVENNIYIALGAINYIKNNYFNSIELITPNNEILPSYSKRALWGWDAQNFVPGDNLGIYLIDGFKIGIRICYEVRFPEYFRELFKEDVLLTFVSFCDVGDEKDLPKYEIIKSHLITRAVENAMYIMSVNSFSNNQLAPTCLINPDGIVLQSAPKNEEYLLSFVLEKDKSNFGRDGRIKHSKELLKIGI